MQPLSKSSTFVHIKKNDFSAIKRNKQTTPIFVHFKAINYFLEVRHIQNLIRLFVQIKNIFGILT